MKNEPTDTCSPSFAEHLANNLKILLETHQINESELARQLDLPYNTVHRIVTGTTSDPRVSTLQQIADYFGVSLDMLINKDHSLYGTPRKETISIPVLQWDMEFTPHFLKTFDRSLLKKWITISPMDHIKNTDLLFALESTKSMHPRYPKGTTFIFHTEEAPIDGDLVIVRFRKAHSISLRELVVDSPKWQLNAVIPGSAPVEYQLTEHELVGVVVLTLIQTRAEHPLTDARPPSIH